MFQKKRSDDLVSLQCVGLEKSPFIASIALDYTKPPFLRDNTGEIVSGPFE